MKVPLLNTVDMERGSRVRLELDRWLSRVVMTHSTQMPLLAGSIYRSLETRHFP